MSFRHLRNSWTQSQGEGAVSEMIQADKLEEEFLNVEWKFFECFSLLNTYSLGCKMQAEKGYLIIGLCILACLIQTRFSSAGKFWIHDQNKKNFSILTRWFRNVPLRYWGDSSKIVFLVLWLLFDSRLFQAVLVRLTSFEYHLFGLSSSDYHIQFKMGNFLSWKEQIILGITHFIGWC